MVQTQLIDPMRRILDDFGQGSLTGGTIVEKYTYIFLLVAFALSGCGELLTVEPTATSYSVVERVHATDAILPTTTPAPEPPDMLMYEPSPPHPTTAYSLPPAPDPSNRRSPDKSGSPSIAAIPSSRRRRAAHSAIAGRRSNSSSANSSNKSDKACS